MGNKTEMVEFEKIVLSKDEIKALKLLQSGDLLIDNESKESLNRLVHLGLAEKYRTMLHDKSTFGVTLSYRGKDFLMFSRKMKRDNRKEAYRYWITTAIAVLALIKSFLPEISVGLEMLWKQLTQ